MGFTIHYHGQPGSSGQLPELGRILERHSSIWDVKVTAVNDTDGELSHLKDGAMVAYHGQVKGFILQPHPQRGSLLFLPDKDGYAAHGCKTQYAPVSIHMAIVRMLKDIEPFFMKLTVNDKGCYWATLDGTEHFHRMNFPTQAIDRVSCILQDEEPHAEEPTGQDLN